MATPSYRFEDLAWGTPRADARRQMAAHGYGPSTPDDVDGLSDMYTVRMMECQTDIHTQFEPGDHLVKVSLSFAKEAGMSPRILFEDVEQGLISVYGESTGEYIDVGYPYYEFDVFTEEALYANKVIYFKTWNSSIDGSVLALSLGFRYVMIHYESALWPAEQVRQSRLDSP